MELNEDAEMEVSIHIREEIKEGFRVRVGVKCLVNSEEEAVINTFRY